MNILSFAEREYLYEINGMEQIFSQTEFVVDGMDISIRLGISHLLPWFGWTRLMEQELVQGSRIEELTGQIPASNQFGSGRAVLYGCHCGCDYCGVISCVASRQDNNVIWNDIRDEEVGCEPDVKRIDRLIFDAVQLENTLKALQMQLVREHRPS